MKTCLFLFLSAALGLAGASFPASAENVDLLQSSCFQARFPGPGLPAGRATLTAAEFEWFDATPDIVSDAGALLPKVDEQTRSAVGAMLGRSVGGRRLLSGLLTVRLRGEPAARRRESEGALCTPAGKGLRCRLLCEGAGEFAVRVDRRGRAELLPSKAGFTLNRCSSWGRTQARFQAGSGPRFALRRTNYDSCGAL
jgi:hypothetical protein